MEELIIEEYLLCLNKIKLNSEEAVSFETASFVFYDIYPIYSILQFLN